MLAKRQSINQSDRETAATAAAAASVWSCDFSDLWKEQTEIGKFQLASSLSILSRSSKLPLPSFRAEDEKEKKLANRPVPSLNSPLSPFPTTEQGVCVQQNNMRKSVCLC